MSPFSIVWRREEEEAAAAAAAAGDKRKRIQAMAVAEGLYCPALHVGTTWFTF